MSDVLIPWETLSEEALQGIAESFILREGTDYGLYEYSLEEKTAHVVKQLKSGKVFLLFDKDTESCNIVSKEELKSTHGISD